VEDQIESANARRGVSKMHPTVEQVETQRKCDSLLLHRTRVLRDLANCHEDRYRKTLSDGLSYLESQLTALGWNGAE